MTDAAPDPSTAEDVIRSIFRASADRLIATESAAIADAPDGVHEHRTSVRRLRSLLAAFHGYLDGSAAQRLRVEFAEWGTQLGVVRDVEVRVDVATTAMIDLEIEDEDLTRRLVDDEREEYSRAHARLCELHDLPRSGARMTELEAFVTEPPFTSDVDGAADTLSRVARKEARRVRRAAKRSDGSIESLHAVRKAGRRLRYVAEALHHVAPDTFGTEYAELAAAGEKVHGVLGDHRDELIFIDRLEHARVLAGHAGERVEPYDRLIARSRERAHDELDHLRSALTAVRKAKASI
ncbi:CHAD domain-containing protein [Microbacterium pumilum]|uniref:CHAD domain-containing protein n=1 Tax=Microbacterium pumilum TaxID=344165 RepID=A0ABN2SAN6_9MICO